MALSKLSIEIFEKTGRPLRIAIDISIWQFQIQAGQGGTNPAIRTFYYRLLRLMSISIQPLFVFDGPHKPPFKRNRRSGNDGGFVPNLLCKQLLHLFGFPFHMAPGEAEAECALLQREGIVDAVLSEDVDTLMFGSGLTLRNWSAEGRGDKSPTHVSAYYAEATKNGRSGLDREGMIIVALMSGGDYITEGIPGCGVKAACEAARAGFGKSLCQLSRSDTAGLIAWRKHLIHEIHTNESKFFRIRHKSLNIPENFPSKEVLGYYTHPVVSSASKLQKLKDETIWDGELNLPGLRLFVAEAFDWRYQVGAKKFIRGLAPALLIQKLRLRGDRRASGYDDVVLTAMDEMALVRAICGKRTHFSTDGLTELRVVYHPSDIVGLDLSLEEDDSESYGRDGLAPANENDDIETYSSDAEPRSRSASPGKRLPSLYDPTQPHKVWILETIAKAGIPLKVEDYEESSRDPKRFLKARAAAKRAATNGGMPKGAMDKFVRISKMGIDSSSDRAYEAPSKLRSGSRQPRLFPTHLAIHSENTMRPSPRNKSSTSTRSTRQTNSAALSQSSNEDWTGSTIAKVKIPRTPAAATPGRKGNIKRPGVNTSPWTIALSSSPQQTPSVTKVSGPQPQNQTSTRFEPSRATSTEINPRSTILSSSIAKKHNYPLQRGVEPADEDAAASSVSVGNVAALQIRWPLNGEKDRDGPSSKKKRSNLVSSNNSSPASPPLCRMKSLTPDFDNRKIDFLSLASRSRSSSPSFPPVTELVSPAVPARKTPAVEAECSTLSSSLDATSTQAETDVGESVLGTKAVNKKKYILLRESLPGAWKEADPSELVQDRSRAWRYSQVECLDMSID